VALAAGLVVLTGAAVRAGRVFEGRFDPDEFQHLHGGWCLAHGLWPYRDYFEHHTPWLWMAIAPLLALVDVDHDPDRAVAFVLAARGVMWTLGSVAVFLTYRLGRLRAGARTGWLAAALLSVTLAFVEKSIEIRPDVPALVCLLGSWLATASALRRGPEERVARGRLALAGFLLGSAALFTQKAVFTLPATTILFGWWTLEGRSSGSWRARAKGVLAFAAGGALPLVATLALFAAHTGIAAFFEFNVRRNVAWRMRFSPVPFLRRIFDANPLLVCLAGAGWIRAARGLGSAGALRSGEALLVLHTLGLLAGAFLNPVPHLHYFLMVLPLAALLAAQALGEAAAALARWTRRTTPAATAALAVLGLAIVAAAPLAAGFQTLFPANPKVQDQLGRLRLVHGLTSPTDTVLDGFTGAGAFRPHAYFYFFLHDQIRALLGDEETDGLRRALRDGEIAPAVILFDFDVQDFSPEVKSFVEENYERAGDPLVWRRKDLALDGELAHGRLDVGRGPTSVLVGRGWGEAEEEGGRWLRRTRGRLSTLRVPLRRPADLAVTVRARSEAEVEGARLGLVINDRECGEQDLVAGWSDYAFPVPQAAWHPGVNRVRLHHEHGLSVESLRLAPTPPIP
jgi:hypothetical protein